MESGSREQRIRREKGQAVVRGLHISELEAAGERRALALRQADEELDRVARLLPDALAAGLTVAEIARVTGISRPTLYELRGRYASDGGDVRLAVLQAVAGLTPLRLTELQDRLGPREGVSEAIGSLYDDGLIDLEHAGFPDEDGTVHEAAVVSMLGPGLDLLESWDFSHYGRGSED